MMRLLPLLLVVIFIFMLPAISVGQADDGFDFTDAVRNPPSDTQGSVVQEESVVSVIEEETVISNVQTDVLAGYTVCIDAGHPSELNDGAIVQNGLRETHINWLVATEMESMLTRMGANVVMTKSVEDQVVSNEERANIANASNADLFIRVHCDTGPSDVHGMTFYYPDRQGTWNGHTGPPLEIIPKCRDAANIIHSTAIAELNGLLKDRGVMVDNQTYIGAQQGGALRGSILSRVPVLLVEMCFLSNAGDAAIIGNAENRTKIASALVAGIKAYLESSSRT